MHKQIELNGNAFSRYLEENPKPVAEVNKLRAQSSLAVPLACFVMAVKLREVCTYVHHTQYVYMFM